MTTLNLRTVKLRPGEQFRDTKEVALEPLELAGEHYVPVPERPEATIAITRASSGHVFELELDARLVGPCFRCLTDAAVTTPIRAREYEAASADVEEELRTPYLSDGKLDLSSWARDAIALSLPEKILCRPDCAGLCAVCGRDLILCRPDCAGLCAVCGRDLNREPHEHDAEPTDPRWAGLAELRDRL